MKVILLKEAPKLGHIGDVKEVNDGYARNFLIPRGLADIATKHGLNVKEAQKRKLERTKASEEKSKEKEASKIDGKKFAILAKADEKGTLYAGLNKQAIIDEINLKGYKIGPNELVLKNTIKNLGNFELELKIAGKKAKITLEILSGDKK